MTVKVDRGYGSVLQNDRGSEENEKKQMVESMKVWGSNCEQKFLKHNL